MYEVAAAVMLRQASQGIKGDTLEEWTSIRRLKDSEHYLGKKDMGRVKQAQRTEVGRIQWFTNCSSIVSYKIVWQIRYRMCAWYEHAPLKGKPLSKQAANTWWLPIVYQSYMLSQYKNNPILQWRN